MKKTPNLNLPVYDTPNVDTFKVEDWNNANETLDEIFGELKNNPNVNAIDITARQDIINNHRSVTSQLEDIVEKEYKKNINYSYEINQAPIISFVFDDGNKEFLTLVKPILDKYNVKATLGIITDRVGENNFLNEEELKQIQNEGHDIVSHTKSHGASIFNNTNPDLVTDEQIEEEYKLSFEWLRDRGFKGCDFLIYPWGNFNYYNRPRFKNIARKYYNVAFNAGGTINYEIHDNMYLARKVVSKTNDIQVYKDLVTQCKSSNGWLVFYTHPQDASQFDASYLEQLILYILSQNIKILPITLANEIKGNAINIGDYEKTSFIVSKSGRNNLNINPPITDCVVTTTTDYTIKNNSKKVGKQLFVNVRLESADKTGNFVNNSDLFTVNELGGIIPFAINSCIITTSTGSIIYQGVMLAYANNNLTIKAYGSRNSNDIRWIDVNFVALIS